MKNRIITPLEVSPHKSLNCKGKNDNFIVEKPGTYQLNQLTKAIASSVTNPCVLKD